MPHKDNSQLEIEDIETASYLITVGAGKYRGVSMTGPGQARFVFRPAPSEEETAGFLRDEPAGARTLFAVKRNLLNQIRQAKVNGGTQSAG